MRRLRDREVDTAEDLQICFKYRTALEAQGLRFPDAQLAAAFACERQPAAPAWHASGQGIASFGFHGVFNFPLVLGEDEGLQQFDSMLQRIGNAPAQWMLLVWHAWCWRYRDLGTRALAARDAALWGQMVQALLARGMSPQRLWRADTPASIRAFDAPFG